MLHDFTGGERKKGAAQSAETTKVVSKLADSMEILIAYYLFYPLLSGKGGQNEEI